MNMKVEQRVQTIAITCYEQCFISYLGRCVDKIWTICQHNLNIADIVMSRGRSDDQDLGKEITVYKLNDG